MTMNNIMNFPQPPSHYISVPKEVILAKSLPEHRISVYTYLRFNQTWDNRVHYSPIYMIEWCGYRPTWSRHNKNNIYEKFKICMQWYFEKNYLNNFCTEKFSQNNFQSSSLNMENINVDKNFGILYDFEIKKIMEYKSSYKPLNSSILLLLFSYIRAYTWVRFTSPTGHSARNMKDKPEIFYSQFKTIGEFLGVSERMISNATSVLTELGFIKTHRMPSYLNAEDEWRTDDVIYVCPYKIVKTKDNFTVLDDYDWRKELENGIKFLQESKYSERKFYQK